MSKHSYKLVYFNGRGRAELSRLIFKAAGVAFEDVRLAPPPATTDWPGEWRAKAPFGQLPILYVDGKVLAQSKAVARYLAREFNLTGKTPWDQARTDMFIDEFDDINTEVSKFAFERDAAKKAELMTKFNTEILPRHLGYLESLLKENNGGKGHLVGTELTWAGLGLANVYDLVGGTDAPFASAPLLLALIKRVRETPKIAEWIKTRPQTPF